jgi:uncharacterized protein YbjT (DUF2867 family)
MFLPVRLGRTSDGALAWLHNRSRGTAQPGQIGASDDRRMAMFVVTGISGHVGSVVASELLDKGEKIRVVVRDEKKAAAFASRGAEVVVGSLDDVAFMTKAFGGATGAFVLLPPKYDAADFRAYQRATADALLAAVKASGLPHVVLLSSIGADLEAGTGPIAALNYFERKLREAGCKLTALRPGFFMENVAGSLGVAKAQGIYPSFTPPEVKMPMIATRDIGLEAARALREPAPTSTVVDIVGPAYDAADVAAILGEKVGKKVAVVAIPPPGWLDALTGAGLPPSLAELYVEMYGAFQSGKVKPCGDRLVEGKTRLDAVIAAL